MSGDLGLVSSDLGLVSSDIGLVLQYIIKSFYLSNVAICVWMVVMSQVTYVVDDDNS